MAIALLVASATRTDGPGPAADLPLSENPADDPVGGTADTGDEPTDTVATGLADRLARLNVPDIRRVTVPDPDGHADPAARALREVAREARAESGDVVLLAAELVIGDELLTRVVRDGHGSVALVLPNADGPPAVRVRGGRIEAAGSSGHTVHAPTGSFAGALRVDAAHRDTLADVADRCAALTALPAFGAADPLTLLLVGLVRAGVPVRARDTGGLPCHAVRSAAEAAEAARAVAGADEDRARLRDAVKSDDGLFATFCASPLTPPFVRWAARRGLTPNTVTCMSLGVALVAAVWFASGDRVGMVVGAVLFYLSFLLDCADGQLARYTRGFTALGAWLDAVTDRVKEYAVYAGLAVGASTAAVGDPVHAAHAWPLAVAALIVLAVRHMIDFCFADRPVPAAAPRVRPLEDPDDDGSSAAPDAGVLQRTSDVRWMYWAKRVVVLPIGERFALIAITAAVANAAWTFWILIGWGTLAAAYTLAGRVLRSLRAPAPASAAVREVPA